MTTATHTEPNYEAAMQRARKRVRELRNYYTTWAMYAVIIPALVIINAMSPAPWWAQWPALGWGMSLLIWGVILYFDGHGKGFGPAWEERKVQELMARANLKRVSGEKQLVQTQLRMLQAQIEPHFLFNTLANVQSLMQRDTPTAQRMLDNFISYLRQSLNSSRQTEGSLGQELVLLKTYLELLQMRMGHRLQFSIDVAPALYSMPLAPMLLQPVVENAIRHGLEPSMQGGSVWIRALHVGAEVRLEVEDNGLGFAASAQQGRSTDAPSGGVGLQNLRERLALLYDGLARLDVLERSPGTCVRLTLPAPKSLSITAPNDASAA